MREIAEGLSSAALVSALEANMLEFWTGYGRAPGRELYEGPDLTRVITGIPSWLFNGIFRAQLAPDTVNATIAATLAYIVSRRLPVCWWIGSATRPSDLGTYLERHGFVRAGDLPGMAADLLALNEDHPTPTDLTIEHIEDNEMLKTWARVAWVASGFPEASQGAFADLEVSLGVATNTSRRRYIGYQSGVPVATSAMLLHAGVAGIFFVATLPEARRQGTGSALTLGALHDAREMGYRVGTLQASEMGFPVYRQLGFQKVCEIGLYLWKG